MGAKPDPLGQIEDPTVRRFVRVVVHVRRFLPFYVGGFLFALTMAVVPTIDGGERGTPPSLAGSSGGAGSAAGPAGATTAAAPARPASRATASLPAVSTGVELASAPSYLDEAFGGAADAGVGTAGAATSTPTADRRGAVDPLAGSPDVPAPDPGDLDDTPDVPEPCRLEPPSPAPAVDPSRELTSGQHTAEALVGQELPVDAATTAAPVTEAAVCNVPEAPVAVPSVPLPATPVSVDGGSDLRGLPLLGLLLRLFSIG